MKQNFTKKQKKILKPVFCASAILATIVTIASMIIDADVVTFGSLLMVWVLVFLSPFLIIRQIQFVKIVGGWIFRPFINMAKEVIDIFS